MPFDKTCTASSVNGNLDRFTVYCVYCVYVDCLTVFFLPLLVFLLLLSGPLLVWAVTVKSCSDQIHYQKGNHHHCWSSKRRRKVQYTVFFLRQILILIYTTGPLNA